MAYRDIDFEDIPKVLKEMGSNRRTIDRNDFVRVMKEMGSVRRLIDDNDISEIIIGAGTGLPPDVTPPAPALGGFSPADNAVGVNTSSNFILQFDSFVRLGSGNIGLKRASDNVTVKNWNVVTQAGTGAGQVNVFAGTQLTLRLGAPLAAATAHYIVWDAGVVVDLPGNPCAANVSTTLWNFTTA